MNDLADIQSVKMPACISTKKFNKQVTYLMARQKLGGVMGAGGGHLPALAGQRLVIHMFFKRY